MDNLEEKLAVSVAAEDIVCVGGKMKSPGHCDSATFLPITNSMIMTVVVIIAISIMFLIAARGGKLIPGRWQALMEYAVESIRGLVEGNISNRRIAKALFPLLGTYFLYILLSNWFSLIPGVGSIGWYHTVTEEGGEKVKEMIPVLRAPNADLNMTLAMALVAIIVVQVAAIVAHGVGGWLKEFAPEPRFMDVILTPLEIISPFSRILSLSFRLFGNVFAGEVLLFVIAKIGGFALVVFLGLEFFVGFIQALVFTLLTIVYVAMVTTEHEGHGHDEEHAHEHGHAEEKLTATQPVA